MSSSAHADGGSLDWPQGFERTAPEEREPYPGDLSPTRKESFESVVEELERWGATSVDISTASQHYVDRPNIPHQHDRPDEVGVVARFRREDEAADVGYAIACDRWETQRENARAIALYARRMRLAERCGVTAADSTFATARLPSGDEENAIVLDDGTSEAPHEVLGVAPDAPDDVVKAAARRLSANVHPDQNEDGDRQEFMRIQNAKEAMLDAE